MPPPDSIVDASVAVVMQFTTTGGNTLAMRNPEPEGTSIVEKVIDALTVDTVEAGTINSS